MGTAHIDNPPNDLQDLEIDDVEFHGFDDHEGGSNNDFCDTLDTLDEEYPFQSLAPPPTSRSYPTNQEAERALYEWTRARGYGLRINRTNWVDKIQPSNAPFEKPFLPASISYVCGTSIKPFRRGVRSCGKSIRSQPAI